MGQLTENEGGYEMSADSASHDETACAVDRDIANPFVNNSGSLPDLLRDVTPHQYSSPVRIPQPETRSVSCQVDRKSHRQSSKGCKSPRQSSNNKSDISSSTNNNKHQHRHIFKQELNQDDLEKTKKMKNLAACLAVPRIPSKDVFFKRNMWTIEGGTGQISPQPTVSLRWPKTQTDAVESDQTWHHASTNFNVAPTSLSMSTSFSKSELSKQDVVVSIPTTVAFDGNRASISVMPVLNDSGPVSPLVQDFETINSDGSGHDTEDTAEYPEIIANYTQLTGYDESFDESVKRQAHSLLDLSGCYYSKLSMQEARQKLKRSAVGTYLLRDTSDPSYFMSLSVKTQRGTTAIRISYNGGRFRLDCEQNAMLKMPSFDCIMKLIQYYNAATAKTNSQKCVFLESTGRRDTPVVLGQPYLQRPHSLKHMCRLTLNRVLGEEQRRRLLIFMSPDIEQFLLEYPYFV